MDGSVSNKAVDKLEVIFNIIIYINTQRSSNKIFTVLQHDDVLQNILLFPDLLIQIAKIYYIILKFKYTEVDSR